MRILLWVLLLWVLLLRVLLLLLLVRRRPAAQDARERADDVAEDAHGSVVLKITSPYRKRGRG